MTGRMWRFALLCALPLSACSLPESEPDFYSRDPAMRLKAMREAIAADDRSAIPHLIAMLDSDDPAVRMFAQRGLEQMTGQTLGYDHAATTAQRRPAVEAWERWWATQTPAGLPEAGE